MILNLSSNLQPYILSQLVIYGSLRGSKRNNKAPTRWSQQRSAASRFSFLYFCTAAWLAGTAKFLFPSIQMSFSWCTFWKMNHCLFLKTYTFIHFNLGTVGPPYWCLSSTLSLKPVRVTGGSCSGQWKPACFMFVCCLLFHNKTLLHNKSVKKVCCGGCVTLRSQRKMLFVTDWVDLQRVLCWWKASWESESKGLNRLFDSLSNYQKTHRHVGALTGRSSGRSYRTCSSQSCDG